MSQDRAFTDTDFSFLIESAPIKDAPYPAKGGFAPADKKCKWFMMINHPEVKNREGGPAKSFSHTFGFDVMDHILSVIAYIARTPHNPESILSLEIPFKFPKKGEGPKFGGVSLRVGRDKSGRIYLSWSSRQIPKVGFFLTSPELSGLTKDGADIDVVVDSSIAAERFVEHYRARVIEWKSQAIVIEAPGSYGGGGNNNNSNGGGYKKPQNNYNGGGQSSSSDDSGEEWDDDVPF